MTEDKVRYSIRAVERVLKILKSFNTQNPQRSYMDIAKETHIPPSTVFKLMQILAEEGFLEQVSENGQYRIGLELFRLGDLYLANKLLVDVANPWLKKLMQRTGLSANLSVRDGSSVVTILTIPGPSQLSVTTRIGERIALYHTASGKALLLDFDEVQLRDLLPPPPWPQRTPNSITNLDQLSQELARSRRRGYTLDNQEGTVGIRCVGFPLRDRRGNIVASISVTGTTIEVTEDVLPSIINHVIDVGNSISQELGFQPQEQKGRRVRDFLT